MTETYTTEMLQWHGDQSIHTNMPLTVEKVQQLWTPHLVTWPVLTSLKQECSFLQHYC